MTIINRTTVNIKIKELTELISVCKNLKYKKQMQTDLNSYYTIKRLLEVED